MRVQKLDKRNLLPRIIFLLSSFLLSSFASLSPAHAATYYVDNCVVRGSDSNRGTSPSSPWLTLAKVSSSTFSPGDFVLLEKGCTWKEQLTVRSSGTAGRPITFGAYGRGAAPILYGVDRIRGRWTVEQLPAATSLSGTLPGTLSGTPSGSARETAAPVGVTLYYIAPAYGGSPSGVFYNGRLLKLAPSKAALANLGKEWWWWDSVDGRIYLLRNPDGETVESGTRNGVSIEGASYITLEGLSLRRAVVGVLLVRGPAKNITIENCNVGYSTRAGVRGRPGTGSNLLIKGNAISHGAMYGVDLSSGAAGEGTEDIIRNNRISNNRDTGIFVESPHVLVQNNIVSNNGATDVQGTGGADGIQVSNGKRGGVASYVTIRYNTIYGTLSNSYDGAGIEVWNWAAHIDIHGNVIYGNYGAAFEIGAGKYVNVYNNTSYGNLRNPSLPHMGGRDARGEVFISASPEANDIRIVNNVIYAVGPANKAISVRFSQDKGAGGLYIANNLWYATGANFYAWDGAEGNNLRTWEGLTGGTTIPATRAEWDLNCDPLFISPDANLFTLRAGSPAIDSGADLGPRYQLALAPSSIWPQGVTTLNQNSNGSGWERGAYVYPKAQAAKNASEF